MDIFDRLAFLGRRFDQQVAPRTQSTRFTLADLLEMFDRNTILELTPYAAGKPGEKARPDPVRKIKVSLLDRGVSAIHSSSDDWFEVFRTAPSGDLSKVKIVAHRPDGSKVGEIRMLVAERSIEYYYTEDPIFDQIR
jgi:hypothetical protein